MEYKTATCISFRNTYITCRNQEQICKSNNYKKKYTRYKIAPIAGWSWQRDERVLMKNMPDQDRCLY